MLTRILALTGILAMVGCSAYREASSRATAGDMRSDAHACQMASLAPGDFFGLLGGAATGFRQQGDMDSCMARLGWVRK